MDNMDDVDDREGRGGRVEKRTGGVIFRGMERPEKKPVKQISLKRRQELSALIGYRLAEKLASRRGLLFHAAGLKVGKKAVLLLAPSGGGKSTVVKHARRARCLHDDKMAVARENGRWLACSVPMLDNSGNWGRVETAPLGALYLIEKRKKHYLVRLSPREAFPRVAAFAIEPTGRERIRKAVSETLMELAEEVPVFRLGYVLGADVSGVAKKMDDMDNGRSGRNQKPRKRRRAW